MQPLTANTFGGLSASYYFRQFMGGLAIALVIYLMTSSGKHPLQADMLLMLIVNTLLYPYARSVYDSVIDFIAGQNVFSINPVFMLIATLTAMLACWSFAVLMAPVGLGYLYLNHSEAAR